MSKETIPLPTTRSWRDIPQQVKPRAMSAEGRKRALLAGSKVALYVIVLGALVWTGWKIAAVLDDDPARMPSAAKADPIKKFDLATDGFLSPEWLIKTLSLPKGATLMELDKKKLLARILANRQVASATIVLNFPSTLSVRISERSPAARVKAQVDAGPAKEFLVARDGVVSEGFGYDPAMIRSLPWLAGISLKRQADGFAPIPGMGHVASLLAQAKLEAEHLYQSWSVVSLAKEQTDDEIEVHTKEGLTIVFSTNQDYLKQLGSLDMVLDMVKAQGGRPLREVNLSIGSQARLTYADLPSPSMQSAANGKPASSFKTPTLFSLQQKTQSEL